MMQNHNVKSADAFSWTHIFLIFFVASWPFANFLSHNAHRNFSWFALLSFWGGALLFLEFFFLVSNAFLKRLWPLSPERVALVICAAWIAFFSYADCASFYSWALDNVQRSLLEQWHVKFTYVWAGVSFLVVLWVLHSSKHHNFRVFLRIFLFTVTSIPLSQAMWAVSFSSQKASPIHVPNFTFVRKPNVYFILLDAYGSADVLKKEFNFDNTPFLTDLRARGFSVQEHSLSNYHFTLASLSSIFAMSYHTPDHKGGVPTSTFYSAWKGPNAVSEVFKKNGYKTVFVEPGPWEEISGSGYEDFCISPVGWGSNFDLLKHVLSSSPANVLLKFLGVNYNTFKNISDLLAIEPDCPKFFYIHNALVHDSMYEESGTVKRTPSHFGIDSSHSEKEYLTAIKWINKDVLLFIDKVRDTDPHAIILVCSDHGPPFLHPHADPQTDTMTSPPDDWREFERRFGNLNTAYIPECHHNKQIYNVFFPQGTSLVNIFRGIFAYLSETTPVFLENASYFIQYDERKKLYSLVSPENLQKKLKGDVQ